MNTQPPSRHVKNQGMNWIRPEKRLAIYLRDGLACCYCGHALEQDAKLTLDHLKPYTKGGSNDARNLATCCLRCNSARGSRAWRTFAEHAAIYLNHGVTRQQIVAHILRTTRRKVDVQAARELMTKRGGFSAALNHHASTTEALQ